MTSEDTSASDPIQLHRDHPWLTAAELAAEVGCSERTIYRRVSRGEIERLETGDGARFRVPRLSREVSVTVSQKGLSVTSSELTDSLSDPVVVEVDGGVSHPVSHCQSPCQSPCQSSVSDTLSVTGRPGAVNLELVRLVGELSRELSEATREAGMWKERCAGTEKVLTICSPEQAPGLLSSKESLNIRVSTVGEYQRLTERMIGLSTSS